MREESIHPDELLFIQTRLEIDDATVAEYVEMMVAGIEFDPAQAIEDEAGFIYVWDGSHRGAAARQLDVPLRLNIETGTEADAEWLALSANQKHGLRRSRADKQLVVRQALLHPHGVQISNRELARHCGIDHKTVGRIRAELEAAGDIPPVTERTVTRAGVTYQQETAGISGREPAAEDQDEAGDETSLPAGGWENEEEDDNDDDPLAPPRPTPPANGGVSGGKPAFENACVPLPTQPQQRTLKFAQVNQGGVALEITLYIDGEAHSVPVTTMFAYGPVAGLPEMAVAEQQPAALVLPYEEGKRLGLVYLDNVLD